MLQKLVLILLLLLLSINSFAIDKRLESYPKVKELYKKASKSDMVAAFDLARFYEKTLKDNVEAIKWYKKSYEYGSSAAPLNLGSLYDDLNQYDKAIAWYKKAYEREDTKAAYNLGVLYKSIKKYEKAILWYKKAAKNGNFDAINNLGVFYHDNGDNITGSAYILAVASYGYSKEEVLTFLKNDWKIDEKTLKKAYNLHQTLDIPKHYTGGID